MRILTLCLLLTLTGCVADGQHVDSGDDYLLKLGEIVSSMATKLSTTDATYLPEAIQSEILVPQLKRHADEPVTPPVLSAVSTAAGSATELWLGGGLSVVGLLGMAKKGYNMYQASQSTVKEVAVMQPDEAKEHLRKKGVHV